MTPDETKEMKELIEFLKENQIVEFDLDRGDVKVRIKFASAVAPQADLTALARLMVQAPAASHSASLPVGASAASAADSEEEAGLHIVKSPMVGTFYGSPSPGASSFVNIGDTIEAGQVICIVEAMKLMNEIESDASGEIVKQLVTNGQPVEYGQPLYAIRKR
jgi:acetyl-CoA carboxylase biotin carboxyl carrier protein